MYYPTVFTCINRRSICLALIGNLLALASDVQAAQSYIYTILDNPNATFATIGFGINDSGQVAGQFRNATGFHSFVYDPTAKSYTALISLSATSGPFAYGLNNNGQVTGSLTDSNGLHGFVLNGSAYTMLDVPNTSGGNIKKNMTYAKGISNDGQVAGIFYDPLGDGNPRGFTYNGGVFTTLDVPNAQFGTWVNSINNNGQAVGFYQDATQMYHGFVYDPITKNYANIDMPNASTQVYGINDRGQVTGNYSNGYPLGFVYDLSTKAIYTFNISNATSVAPNGINNKGQVIGWFTDAAGTHGFIATPTVVSTQISLLDPVPLGSGYPSLLNGAAISTDPTVLASGGRPVQGIAADGVAQVVVSISATTVGENITIGLSSNPCTNSTPLDCIDNYGQLFDPQSPQSTPTNSVTVKAVSTPNGPTAFAAYRAPMDFVRTNSPTNAANDSIAAKRSVFLSLASNLNGNLPDFEVKVVRPPVVLLHGLNSEGNIMSVYRSSNVAAFGSDYI